MKNSTTSQKSSMARRINVEMRHPSVRDKLEQVRKIAIENGLRVWKAYEIALDLFIRKYKK
jgi:hypothetical protein